MRLVCPNYFTDEVLTLTRNMARNVSAAATRPLHRELAVQDFDDGGQFTAAFDKTGYKVIDMDLDEWGAQQQAERCGMRFFELTRDAPGGSTDPDAFRRAVLAHYRDKELDIYPTCFTETQLGKFQIEHAQQQIGAPHRFSLRASLKRSHNAAAAAAAPAEEKGEEKEDEWVHVEAEEEEEEMASDGDVDEELQGEDASMGYDSDEEPEVLREAKRHRAGGEQQMQQQSDNSFQQRMLQAAQNGRRAASRSPEAAYDAFRNVIR
jgi:hypothetical protein